MIFKKIRLRNFRNLCDLDLNFSDRLNIFVGQNGQGKTNILESIYLLINGNSFRYSGNETFINFDKNQTLIFGKVFENELTFDLRLAIENKRKSFYINSKKSSPSKLTNSFSTIIFSPESLSAIKESSDQRRQLVDELLISSSKQNHQIITDFKRVYKTRNKVLKDYHDKKTSKEHALLLLEAINPSYLKLASLLTYKRISALKNIISDLNFSYQNISKNKNVDISVEYVISGANSINFDQKNVYDIMRNRMIELQENEFMTGNSLVGPQKHDINILCDGKDSRFFCSQGQQRALILAFKMAQIVYHSRVHGSYPILMLDDVLSELDEEKRKSLIEFLHRIKTQIFITTTDLSLPRSFSQDECRVFNVENGNAIQEEFGSLKESYMKEDYSVGAKS